MVNREGSGEKTVMSYFKTGLLSRNFLGGTRENHGKP
jgi:hypothetical protein